MAIDRRIIEALETGRAFTTDDNDYVSVVNVSASGVTLRPNPGNPYGDRPGYYPLSSYGKTWALTAEEIKR